MTSRTVTIPDDLRAEMRQWWQSTYRRKRDFAREKNRRRRALANPAFWRAIAEMQGRLGWPANGISDPDFFAWPDALLDAITEGMGGSVLFVARDVELSLRTQRIIRKAVAKGAKLLLVPGAEPSFPLDYEAKLVCDVTPTLDATISLDTNLVKKVAAMGLDAVLEQHDDFAKGDLSGIPIMPAKQYQFRGKLSKGRTPLDPDEAVKIFRLKQQGKPLVDIGYDRGWKLYDTDEGGQHCPKAAYYRDRGREIIEAYDADSRPSLRVPSFDECVRHGWISLAA